MKTHYFTFGWGQAHDVGGFTYDRNVVVKITAKDPREVMIDHFGMVFSNEYFEKPNMLYYPRGIKELPGYEEKSHTSPTTDEAKAGLTPDG